jgi:UTP--glucose-1-phosphate uridylyltransferase
MITLMAQEPFFAHIFKGRVHDTGTKLGFLTANLAYALEREDLRHDLAAELRSLL